MLKVGVNLPSFGVDETAGVREHARHAEELGLESIWVGDHLIPVRPFLDSTMVLATAAAVTEHVKIGFGVMVLALRPAAWAAKQIASLQHLSGGRVLLGIGSGGSVHGDAAWRAVGIPYAERAQRTDAALEILPSLVEGKPTNVNGEVITLSPGATMSPLLIGAAPCAEPPVSPTNGIRRSPPRPRSPNRPGGWPASPPNTAARRRASRSASASASVTCLRR